MKLATLLDM